MDPHPAMAMTTRNQRDLLMFTRLPLVVLRVSSKVFSAPPRGERTCRRQDNSTPVRRKRARVTGPDAAVSLGQSRLYVKGIVGLPRRIILGGSRGNRKAMILKGATYSGRAADTSSSMRRVIITTLSIPFACTKVDNRKRGTINRGTLKQLTERRRQRQPDRAASSKSNKKLRTSRRP